jgi:hypothetical protein
MVFACDLSAVSPAARPRYNVLVKRVREAMRDCTKGLSSLRNAGNSVEIGSRGRLHEP